MKRKFGPIIAMISLLVMYTQTPVFGSGFGIYENSSRAAGFCSAFVAQADDPSAAFYNPAGLTQLSGTHVMAGQTGYLASYKIKFADGESEKLKDKFYSIPNLYASYQINPNFWFSMGIFVPFGLGNEYDENWRGRYNTYFSEIRCVEVNPGIVYKFSDQFSMGIGVSYQTFEIEAKQKISPRVAMIEGLMGLLNVDRNSAEVFYAQTYAQKVDGLSDIDQHVEADDDGLRYNISARLVANDKLSFGIQYRSSVTHDKLKGDATYQNIPSMSEFESQIYNAAMQGRVSLPDIVWLGAAYRFTPKLTVEFDYVQTGWGRLKDIRYSFENGLGDRVQERRYKDANCYRLGMEYHLTEVLDLRCGYLFDESPIPDGHVEYAMPSNDRHMGTIGVGYRYGKWKGDAHYASVFLKDRKLAAWEEWGMYEQSEVKDGLTHQLGFNISYAF